VCLALVSQGQPPNVALNGTATQSTTGWGWVAENAIDGNLETGSHTETDDLDRWWEVELDQDYDIKEIVVHNRASCCDERIVGVVVIVLDADRNEIYVSEPIADHAAGSIHAYDNDGAGFSAVRFIRAEGGTDFLTLMEVQAFQFWPYAYDPVPADGAVDVTSNTLAWAAADGAVSYNVNVGTDPTALELVQGSDATEYTAETPFVEGTTYYWRIDAVDAGDEVSEGDLWSFTTLPWEAHFPNPTDGATNYFAEGVTLTWTIGKDAMLHNIYFGTDQAAVAARDASTVLRSMSLANTVDLDPLDVETAYYWAVDEWATSGTIYPGPVWSFSTVPVIPPVDDPSLVAWWTFDTELASSATALDMSGNARHGVLQGDTQWVDGYEGGALQFDGNGDYVNINGYKGILAVDGVQQAFTVANWFKTTGNGEMVTWGINGTATRLTWRIDGGSLRTEHNAGNLRGNTIVNDGEWHHGALVVTEGANLRVPATLLYVDGLPDSTFSGSDNAYNLTEGPDVSIGRRADNNSRHFPGSIDDVRIYSRTLEIAEIRTLAGVAELPYGPTPTDGEIDLPASDVVLAWNPGEGAVEQDVYLGTDAAAVADANTSDATGIYLGRQAETELALAELGRGVTYFWKVNGVKADGTAMPAGPVWSFRIADRNTDNWASMVDPNYLDTYVQNGAYDIGALSGDISYEFIVNSNPDETEASMALIGRIGHGDTTVALKYEQWNNTGLYGATVFGVADHDFGVPTAPGEYTHLVFVSSEDTGTTELYVNGELAGSVPTAITLSGIVGIGQAIRDPEGVGVIDNFDGTIFGVAIYDRLLTADEIAGNADSYFNPIAVTDPDLLIHYDFESGEGSMALDRSGHGNHGQFIGTPEWVEGLFGSAVSIVLEDVDYIQTAAPLGIVSNTVSVTGWVMHDELPAGWSGILTHRGTSPGCLGLQHDGTELRYMWGVDEYWSFSSGLALPVGEWYFAALTISPDQGKFHLNGVDQTATNVAPHQPTNFDSLIRVGRDHTDGRIMTSLIDDVTLYNRTLTDLEIQSMLEGGPAPL